MLALQAALHLVGDGLRLSGISPRAEHEEVGVRADGPQIEDDDVLRQLSLGEAGDEASLFERGQSGRVLSSLLNLILARPDVVQPSPLDLPCNGRGNEVVDRLTTGDPLTNLARRDRALVDLEHLHVALG